MKQKWLIFLLGLLGIGCAESECMYGCPLPGPGVETQYTINGVVYSKRSVPIRNIRVRTADGSAETLTDQNGRYVLSGPAIDSDNQLVAEDIDGEENGGLFRTKEFEAEFRYEDRKSVGNYEMVCNVVLELEKSGKE